MFFICIYKVVDHGSLVYTGLLSVFGSDYNRAWFREIEIIDGFTWCVPARSARKQHCLYNQPLFFCYNQSTSMAMSHWPCRFSTATYQHKPLNHNRQQPTNAPQIYQQLVVVDSGWWWYRLAMPIAAPGGQGATPRFDPRPEACFVPRQEVSYAASGRSWWLGSVNGLQWCYHGW